MCPPAPTGDAETRRFPAARQQPVAAVQHSMRGGGQIPADLHADQAAAGEGQDAHFCGSRGPMLPPQALPGAVRYSRMRAQLGAPHPVQVRLQTSTPFSSDIFGENNRMSSAFLWNLA